MNVVREVVRDAAIGVAVSDTVDGLSAIHTPGCAAAVWRRQIDSDFQGWLDALPAEVLPQGRLILRPETARAAVTQLCEIAETPATPERKCLIDDVAALAESFASTLGARYLRLRLDPVTTDACRRFHVDAIHARLVCTYRGPGTQYGLSTDGQPPTRVFSVPTGAPILMRGTLWPDGATGVLHRSPPIEGTGTTRLVLVLDVVDDPEDAI